MNPDLVLIASAPGAVGGAGDSHGTLRVVDPGVGIVETLALPTQPHVIEVHPERSVAYVASWDEPAMITAVALPRADAPTLRVISSRASGGALPCSLAVDRSGEYLIAAHYDGGGIVAFPILEDGSLGEPGPAFELAGNGPVTARQDRTHPHCVVVDPHDGTIVVSDLGADRIVRLALDLSTAGFALHNVGSSVPGAGPRHLVVLPDGRALVSDELSSTVSWYATDATASAYECVGSLAATLSTKPGPNFPSDIAVTADATHAYVANRGAGTIAAFAVGPGGLRRIGEYDTGGDWPLSLAITSGRLHCVLRDSGVLRSWLIDENNGELSEPSDVSIPYPTWVTPLHAELVSRAGEGPLALTAVVRP